MKTIFKLVFFSIMLNLAVGIMQVAVTNASGVQVFGSEDYARVASYDANGTAAITSQYQTAVNPGGVTEDKGNLVFRLLDLISLGFIKRIVTTLNTYMFGFVNMLNAMVGRWLNPALYTILFGADIYVTPSSYIPVAGILKGIIMIGYITAAFELWTNKSVTE
jgi:hypothetical protein